MKVVPEDMDDVREVIKRSWMPRGFYMTDEQRDIALALIMVRIWDRGYEQALADQTDNAYMSGDCPYDFSHTRQWCGYRDCRES